MNPLEKKTEAKQMRYISYQYGLIYARTYLGKVRLNASRTLKMHENMPPYVLEAASLVGATGIKQGDACVNLRPKQQ